MASSDVAPRREIGLGTLLRWITGLLHVPHCGGCERRAAVLDRRIRVRLPRVRLRRGKAARAGGCWRYTGSCTGFGSRSCVRGPKTQEPDAEFVEQCCGGWFQYPWIEVCPGGEARTGCGVCFW